MPTYFDTSSPGGSGPLTATGQVFYFGDEEDFYLAVSSDVIAGQTSGPSVEFDIYSRKAGKSTIQVDYGTTNTTFPVKYRGYMVRAVVPASGGSVSCRVIVSSDPFPLTVRTVPATTSDVNVVNTPAINLVEISGVAQHGADIVAPIQAIGGTVQTIGGVAMAATSVQDPPQYTTGGGKKVVPTHDLGA